MLYALCVLDSGDGQCTTTSTAVSAVSLSNVASLVTGHYHSCAVTLSGGVKCWGYNFFGACTIALRLNTCVFELLTCLFHVLHMLPGQVGDGSSTSRCLPVNVNGLTSGVAAAAAGNIHTCALLTSGASCMLLWVACGVRCHCCCIVSNLRVQVS